MEASWQGKPIILASSSPRRQELLQMLGCPFEVVVPSVDEGALERAGGAGPGTAVEEISRRKVAAVAPRFPGRVVVGADTVVVLDGRVLGKPQGPDDAVRMLEALSGRWHSVYTGLAVRGAHSSRIQTRHVRTDVRFRNLEPAWIRRYVETGEPLDKAGAYGIQGRGALFVAEIRGCYFTVVGLPLAALSEMLEAEGVSLL